MNKKIIYVVFCILVIVIWLIANISGSSKDLTPEKVEDLMDVKDKINSNEEIKYDDSLIYDVNATYLDQNFAITLTNIDYDDNLVKYSFIFENTTENEQSFPLNRLVCEINQQSVENTSDIVFLIKKGEKKEINLECVATKEDDANIIYRGKLFDGRDIDIRFKKK